MAILPSPVIIAHRGFRRLYPENTLVSFQAARQAGAHMIELDVTSFPGPQTGCHP